MGPIDAISVLRCALNPLRWIFRKTFESKDDADYEGYYKLCPLWVLVALILILISLTQ